MSRQRRARELSISYVIAGTFFCLLLYTRTGASDSFSSLPLCQCQRHQVQHNGKCISEESNAVMQFLQFYFNAATFTVSSHVVDKLLCRKDTFPASLKPLPHEFSFVPTGELVLYEGVEVFSSNQYCIGRVLENNGTRTSIVPLIEVCLEKFALPVCCNATEDSNNALCRQSNFTSHFDFFSYYSSLALKFQSVLYQVSLTCPASVEMTEVQLREDTQKFAFVYYFGNQSTSFEYLGGSEDKYCLVSDDNTSEESYVVRYCKTKRYRKCCFDNEYFSDVTLTCEQGTDDTQLWTPQFQFVNGSIAAPGTFDIKLVYGKPFCLFHKIASTGPNAEEFYLLPNGDLYVEDWRLSIPSHQYCIDNFMATDGIISKSAIVCFPDTLSTDGWCENVKKYLYPTLLLVSCMFLSVTVLVYCVSPELHSKLHGKILLSHVIALLAAYLFLAITQIAIRQITMSICRAFGFIIQISFLGAFFWLNVMCFDIWWTLRVLRPQEHREDSRHRFFLYSIYAWGAPSLIAIATFIMDFVIDARQFPNLLLPGFGRENCWFQENSSQWAYFYSFVLVLTVANICFFVAVAVIILKVKNNPLLKEPNAHHNERLWVYVKLFVVMGITWICEVVSWQEGSCPFWIITDIINCLQGVLIFYISCRKRIVERLCPRPRHPQRSDTRTTTFRGSTSTQLSSLPSIESISRLKDFPRKLSFTS